MLILLVVLLLLAPCHSDEGASDQANDISFSQIEQLIKESIDGGLLDSEGLSKTQAEGAHVNMNPNGESSKMSKLSEADKDGSDGGMEMCIQRLEKKLYEEGVIELDIDTIIQRCTDNDTTEEIALDEQTLQDNEDETGKARRQIMSNIGNRWWHGIVPYSFNIGDYAANVVDDVGQKYILMDMKYYEENTCLTFPEWTPSLQTELGLPHNNYMKYIVSYDGGCWSVLGNSGQVTGGQAIACCGGGTVCLHEIGHALGLQHEQERSMRDQYVKLHPENTKKQYVETYNNPPFPPPIWYDDLAPYDYGSIMHYGLYAFSYNGMQTIEVLDVDEEWQVGMRLGGRVSHYDLLTINEAYNCTAACIKENPSLACENDGFVGLRKHKCMCICPVGFMGDNCEKLYRPSAPTVWPAGAYGFPASSQGCPSGTWLSGSRKQVFSSWEVRYGQVFFPADMSVDKQTMKDSFCMRPDPAPSGEEWPAGTYCLYQQGDACPKGFASGYILFNNTANSTMTNEGQVPKGVYAEDTMYYYCCRSDGPASEPIHLPTEKPFLMFRHKGTCQSIAGMNVEGGSVHMATKTNSAYQEPIPYFFDWYGGIWMLYCHYSAINYECGEIVDLTAESPSYKIQSPNYPSNYSADLECSWYIKAPKGSILNIDFKAFDIQEGENGNCPDSLEIRAKLLGQPGQRYCGHAFKRNVIAWKEFVYITFRSGELGNDKGFSGTVSILDKTKSMCYSVDDNGATYRGTVNYTEHYFPCMTWEKAKHCSVNLFDKANLDFDMTGHNYCRNPDKRKSPWCFINEYCEMGHCDVCGLGKCYDLYGTCEDEMGRSPTFCNTTDAFNGCHKSCNFCGTGRTEQVQKCGIPKVKDPIAVLSAADKEKTEWTIGEQATFVCKGLNYTVTSTTTCLSDGSWRGKQIFCNTECPDGWTRFKEYCYKMFMDEKRLFWQADEFCQTQGGHLVSIHSAEENKFVWWYSLPRSWTYIGFSDQNAQQGDFRWTNGDAVQYTNWGEGQPSNGSNKDCVEIDSSTGKWEDVWCKWHYQKYPFCKVKSPANDDADVNCIDEEIDCKGITDRNPEICSQYDKMYAFRFCRRTCGLCPYMQCALPQAGNNSRPITSTASYLRAGQYFEYECLPEYKLSQGDLKRACNRDGQVSGQAPTCLPKYLFTDAFGFRPVRRYHVDGDELITILESNMTRIDREGQVTTWKVYSNKAGILMAQIWRRVSDNEWKLVGQNMLSLRPKRINIIDVPAFERITVKPNDTLGWYYPPGAVGLPKSKCDAGYDTRTVYQKTGIASFNDVQVGSVMVIPKLADCQTYSIQAVVAQGTAKGYNNIAAADFGGKCVAASSAQELCVLALDGNLTPYDSSWITEGEGAGAWIKLQFVSNFTLVGARFMQRFGTSGQNQRLRLQFSDGTAQKVGLRRRHGVSMLDNKGLLWDSVELKRVDTAWVNISVQTVYSTNNNGFVEIEFYAECFTGWTRFQDACYKLHTGENKFFWEGEDDCKAMGAHISSVTSQAENDFLNKFRTGVDIYLGIQDSTNEGTWSWVDGSAVSFTNWKANRPDKDGGSVDCSSMESDGTWYDLYCQWHYARKWVCKKPMTVAATSEMGRFVGSPSQPRSHAEDPATMVIIVSDQHTFKGDGRVSAWKAFSPNATRAAFHVWRRTSPTSDTFLLVGQNFVTLKAGRVTLVSVPLMDRIAVRAGDLIGFMPLSTGPVYDDCSKTTHPMDAFSTGRSNVKSLQPGTEVTFGKHTNWRTCRLYSFGGYITPDAVELMNIASTGQCSASAESSTCGLATNNVLRFTSLWPATSATWYLLDFTDSYHIHGLRLMQGFDTRAQIKDLDIAFSDETTKKVILLQNVGTSIADYLGQTWEAVEFSPPIDSTSIKLTVTSLYDESKKRAPSTAQAGFVEIQVYASGLTGWTTFNHSAYRLHTGADAMFWPGEEECIKRGAHIASIHSAEENNFINSMRPEGVYIYLGIQDYNDEGNWTWVDGSPVDYTNWQPGAPRADGGSYDCSEMRQDGTWNDKYCKWHYATKWICKRPMNVVEPVEVQSGVMALCKTSTLGAEYVGSVQTTKSGSTCQRWDSQTPQTHSYTDPSKFAGEITDLSKAENFCRNPGDPWSGGLWCYTTDPATSWDSCDVPLCKGSSRKRRDSEVNVKGSNMQQQARKMRQPVYLKKARRMG